MARIETEKLLIRLVEHELAKRRAAGTFKGESRCAVQRSMVLAPT